MNSSLLLIVSGGRGEDEDCPGEIRRRSGKHSNRVRPAGHLPPEFDYTSPEFSLIPRNDPYTGERLDSLRLNERQIAIIDCLKLAVAPTGSIPSMP